MSFFVRGILPIRAAWPCIPWMILVGCGESESGPGQGSAGSTGVCCEHFKTIPGATATVALTGTVVDLGQRTGTAQNQAQVELLPFPEQHLGVLRRGTCGTTAALLRGTAAQGASGMPLLFVDLSASSPAETVEAAGSAGLHDSALFFDAECKPLVVRVLASGALKVYQRTLSSGWDSSDLAPDYATIFGAAPVGMSLAATDVGSDGSIHLIAVGTAGGEQKVLLGHRGAATSDTFAFEAATFPPAKEVSAWRVDAAGTLHALYTKTDFPCDPCDLNLYYGRLSKSGTWTSEVVQASKWGAPDDEFATHPSLALDSSAEPIVAATHEVRATTGSLKSAELRVYGRRNGVFCWETAASQSDGYQGADGPQYTGDWPEVQVDGTGHIFVAFMDIAQWHSGGMANNVHGQLRVAVRTGSGWSLATILEQSGQTKSPKPLVAFDSPSLVVSPQGTELTAIGSERSWETDSIYNTAPVPVTIQGRALRATVTIAP